MLSALNRTYIHICIHTYLYKILSSLTIFWFFWFNMYVRVYIFFRSIWLFHLVCACASASALSSGGSGLNVWMFLLTTTYCMACLCVCVCIRYTKSVTATVTVWIWLWVIACTIDSNSVYFSLPYLLRRGGSINCVAHYFAYRFVWWWSYL